MRREFLATSRMGQALRVVAGYDEKMCWHFLVLEHLADHDVFFSNLDQPGGRAGMNLVRVRQVLSGVLADARVPADLYTDLDAAWRKGAGLTVTGGTFPPASGPHRGHPFPYLLTLHPDGHFEVDLLTVQSGQAHLAPEEIGALVRQRLGDSHNRVYANYVHPDSPLRGYLTWCRDDAQSLETNVHACRILRTDLPLGGPLCVAVHYDDRLAPDHWGPSEVLR